jgi:4-amino-4-deoxy-L-arabinose transferase-like glycosyltransferase
MAPRPDDKPQLAGSMSKALRLVSATLGSAAWGYSLIAANHLSPKTSFLLWLAALLLWAAALFSRWPVRRPDRVTAFAAAAIILMMIPRVDRLSERPYDVRRDEAIHPVYGEAALHDQPWELVAGASPYFRTPYLTHVLQAWPCLFSEPLFGARLGSVLIALASLVSTYVLARRLFGDRAAVIALTVLASSYWHMAYSRVAYPYMQVMLALPLTLYVLVKGIDEHSLLLEYIGGVLLGLSILLYTPARIVVPVFALYFGHRLFVGDLRLRDATQAAGVIALAAAIILSPYLRAQGLGGVLLRYGQTTMEEAGPLHRLGVEGWLSPAGRRLLGNQLQAAASVYYTSGAWMAISDYSPAPLLDRTSLALALLGLGLALAGLRDSRRFLLVVWIAGTFIVGQVLTDIPAAAYRAGPLLPALAICAGLGVSELARVVFRRWSKWQGPVSAGGFVLLLIAVVPSNLVALNGFLIAHNRNVLVGMARLVGASSQVATYELVTLGPVTGNEIFKLLGQGRVMRDVPALMDSLGMDVDPTRDAMFVLDSGMTAAAAAIRRCYPGAVLWSGPFPPGTQPVLGLFIPRDAVVAGRNCTVPPQGPGLLARYFKGAEWDGAVYRERIEDWPFRWVTREDAEQFRSVEWSGFLRLPVPGMYRFELVAQDAAGTATIGDRVQLENSQAAGASFGVGQFPLRWRCQPRLGGFCWLRWAPPGGDYGAIPPEFLTPAMAPP